jgi:hypothetical protein
MYMHVSMRLATMAANKYVQQMHIHAHCTFIQDTHNVHFYIYANMQDKTVHTLYELAPSGWNRARPVTWGESALGQRITLWRVPCVLNALMSGVEPHEFDRTAGWRSLSAVHMQAALVLFNVQTARATKQWNLRTLTSRPGGGELERSSQAESMLSLRRLVPHFLPTWCFCKSTIGTSAAAVAPGRVRP